MIAFVNQRPVPEYKKHVRKVSKIFPNSDGNIQIQLGNYIFHFYVIRTILTYGSTFT